MQRRLNDGKRPRITVSLDPEEYEWVQSFGDSPSESYTVSRILKAARLAGLTLEGAMSGGVLEDFRDWLKTKRKKTKMETELIESLTEYLSER